MSISKAERKWQQQLRAKQAARQAREPQPLPNESDFARVHWTGQSICDEFFRLNEQPEFKGLGESVMLPAHKWSVSRTPTAGISVLEAYPNGLAYAEQVFGAGGVMLLFAAVGGALGYLQLSILFDGYLEFGVSTVLSGLMTAFGFLCIWFMFRFDTSGYRYRPVLFDRAAGKVHVFFDHTKFFGLWPLFGGGQCSIQSYDWSCVRAQVKRFRTFTGTVAQDNASLSCVVFTDPHSGVVAGEFPVGVISSGLAVQSLLDHWEHIRRFMEFEGPQFVKGEGPYVPAATQSLLGAVFFGQPFIGPGAAEQWQAKDAVMIVWQLIAPFIFPVTMLLGLMRWTSLHIRTKPKWPKDILHSVGDTPLMGEELDAASNVIPQRPTHSAM